MTPKLQLMVIRKPYSERDSRRKTPVMRQRVVPFCSIEKYLN